jgi:hypothetical protein
MPLASRDRLHTISANTVAGKRQLSLGPEDLAHPVVAVLRAENAGTKSDALAHAALVKQRWIPLGQCVTTLSH